MTRRVMRLARLSLSLALSAVLLWFVFRNVDMAAMWSQARAADHRYTLGYCAALVAIQLCRTYRWDVLIRPFTQVSRAALFRISGLGLLLVLVLPLRLGEFARPYLVKRETGASMSSGMGAAVVERVVDGLLVTLLFFATTMYLGSRYAIPGELRFAALIALAVFGCATVVVVAALLTHGWVPDLIERLVAKVSPGLAHKSTRVLRSFIAGLRSMPNARAISAVVGWTFAYWTINGLGFWAMMLAFGWDVPVVAGFTLVSVLVIGVMIPAGPGFLGTYQAAISAGLAIFGVNPTDAAAYGLVVYPLNVAVQVAFGLPYLFRRGERLADIVNASQEEAGEPEA